MKRTAGIFAAALLCAALAGCGAAQSTSEPAAAAETPAATAEAQTETEAETLPVCYAVTTPEGFTESEHEDCEYYCSAEDGSCISIVILPLQYDPDTLTEEYLTEQVELAYDEYMGIEATAYYEEAEGYADARRLDVAYSDAQITFTQRLIFLRGQQTVLLSMTDCSGKDSHAELFDACLQSLTPVYEGEAEAEPAESAEPAASSAG